MRAITRARYWQHLCAAYNKKYKKLSKKEILYDQYQEPHSYPLDVTVRSDRYSGNENKSQGETMKRRKMSRRGSNKNFKRNSGTMSINFRPNPLRGGYRL